MKAIIKIACAAAFAALAATSCKTETVYVYPDTNKFVSRLNVYPRTVNMSFVDDYTLNVTIRPSTASYKWESSDPSVAYVDKNDKIVALKTGNIELTVSAGDFTQTIPVRISSAIVGSSYFIESGKTESMSPEIQVLPEGTPFTVISNNMSRIFVNPTKPMEITAMQNPGSASVTITTFDGVQKTIDIGVVDPANVVTVENSKTYHIPGGYFDLGYDMQLLTMAQSGRTYNVGGTWTGSGRGIALKLGQSNKFDTLPEGEYNKGTSEGCLFADNHSSYVINAAGSKEYVTGGKVIVSRDGVKASVTTASNVYIFNFSGRTVEEQYPFAWGSVRTETITNDMVRSVSARIDRYASIFWGDVYGLWEMTFNINGTNSKLLFSPEDADTAPAGNFYPSGNYYGKGLIIIDGRAISNGWTRIMFPFSGAAAAKSPDKEDLTWTISNCNYTTSKYFTADYSGQIGWTGDTEYVSEVNLSRSYDVVITFQLKSMGCTITN